MALVTNRVCPEGVADGEGGGGCCGCGEGDGARKMNTKVVQDAADADVGIAPDAALTAVNDAYTEGCNGDGK